MTREAHLQPSERPTPESLGPAKGTRKAANCSSSPHWYYRLAPKGGWFGQARRLVLAVELACASRWRQGSPGPKTSLSEKWRRKPGLGARRFGAFSPIPAVRQRRALHEALEHALAADEAAAAAKGANPRAKRVRGLAHGPGKETIPEARAKALAALVKASLA